MHVLLFQLHWSIYTVLIALLLNLMLSSKENVWFVHLYPTFALCQSGSATLNVPHFPPMTLFPILIRYPDFTMAKWKTANNPECQNRLGYEGLDGVY